MTAQQPNVLLNCRTVFRDSECNTSGSDAGACALALCFAERSGVAMAETETPPRGTFEFEVTPEGSLLNTAANVETLRRLWLDRKWVNGEAIGPGDPGDFDYGAWHVACHLVAGGGVRRASDGRLLWLEISHDPPRDEYFASLTRKCPEGTQTLPLDSAEGLEMLAGSEVLGFVEGNSTGRTSARRVFDPPRAFNLWRRQDFDQPVASEADGGKVWEHWCTLRDIRETSRMGTSLLTAYVSLVAALGDRFPAAVARGRRDYGHPWQLCVMVQAGFVSEQAATWETKPTVLPPAAETRLCAAEPGLAVEACELLDWGGPPRYYMFKRRIERWSETEAVRRDLQEFRQSAKE